MVTIKAYGPIFVADVKRSATGTPKTICPSFYAKAIMIICQTGFDEYFISICTYLVPNKILISPKKSKYL